MNKKWNEMCKRKPLDFFLFCFLSLKKEKIVNFKLIFRGLLRLSSYNFVDIPDVIVYYRTTIDFITYLGYF